MNVANIGPVSGLSTGDLGVAPAKAGSGGAFGDVIGRFLEGASAQQTQADQAVRELAVGHTDQLHRVLLSVSQADLAFRLVLEIRNRVGDALQEVMRMQV